MDLLEGDLAGLADAVGPEPDDVLEAMTDRADREGFPTVGPRVGGWLALLARLADARRVFEFGSGFGYSAYWFARAVGPDGTVVLTEVDRVELDAAREYFRRGGLTDRARFEAGDAIDTVDRYDGPFDVVLLDNEKDRYVEAFEAVRGKLAAGAVVLADNAVTAGTVDRADVRALLDGETVPGATGASRGIASYLGHVRSAEGFETTLLPVGEGVAVSVNRG
jgi:predicted O-methyltransferase YrrM